MNHVITLIELRPSEQSKQFKAVDSQMFLILKNMFWCRDSFCTGTQMAIFRYLFSNKAENCVPPWKIRCVLRFVSCTFDVHWLAIFLELSGQLRRLRNSNNLLFVKKQRTLVMCIRASGSHLHCILLKKEAASAVCSQDMVSFPPREILRMAISCSSFSFETYPPSKLKIVQRPQKRGLLPKFPAHKYVRVRNLTDI